MEMPNEESGWRAPIAAISWRTILASSPSRPPPPYSFGHGPAFVAHALEPEALRLGGKFGVAPAPEGVAIGGDRLSHLARTVLLQPGAGFLAEFFEVGHRTVSTVKIVARP
jgi:hypothetical protein